MDTQQRTIRARADQRGWDVLWVEDPGRSGQLIRRPGIRRAIAMLEAGEAQAQALVVPKLDRLVRNAAGVHALLDTLASMDGTWSCST